MRADLVTTTARRIRYTSLVNALLSVSTLRWKLCKRTKCARQLRSDLLSGFATTLRRRGGRRRLRFEPYDDSSGASRFDDSLREIYSYSVKIKEKINAVKMLMMLPFEAPTIFEGIHKSYFQMPRVVKNQRHKFENEELFRQLSHESTVRYTGFKDRPLEERQMKFLGNCHEGHTEVSVIQSGIQFTLMFNPTANLAFSNEGCDFDKEQGKVSVCVHAGLHCE